MSSEAYHEPYERLSPPTRDMHRAILSLMEELEAIDWYQQRADVCDDDALRAVLVHNKNEEIEHAMMTLEWIRRTSKEFDERARTYLFQSGPITEIEEAEKAGTPEGEAEEATTGAPAASAGATPAATSGSLGIGSLRAMVQRRGRASTEG